MAQSVRKQKPVPGVANDRYAGLRAINGWHPFKDKVPGAYVEYSVRKRKNAKVVFFNFELAKEMGLIPKTHDNKLNRDLSQAILDTFAIQIINEYDIIHETKIPKQDIKENRYMATRYLQLQHPSKKGMTSGDGRSIWNGVFSGNRDTWDITSCGTGATCLSPATALNKKFFRTGDPMVAYGCGYSDLLDGLSNAVFSEIFAKNGIKTERTLVVLEFPKGLSINVRAGKNLLRPSHFFNHLRQQNYGRLKSAVDFFIDRQIANGDFDKKACAKNRYEYLLNYVCENFATICAQFESEYIFCWLDWDGDNILIDGGIIDYGSIRQFGLFHHEYRYDDDERWSTKITEQKTKARYIVQTFAQLCDYLQSRKKKPIGDFKNAAILRRFDRVFEDMSKRFLLRRLGFNPKQLDFLIENRRTTVDKFQKIFSHFERAVSKRGPTKTSDGITRDAIFCMRDILRELPHLLLDSGMLVPISAQEFIDVMKSNYASRKDAELAYGRRRQIDYFQSLYIKLVEAVANTQEANVRRVLSGICERSDVINRFERITGDAIIAIGAKIANKRNEMRAEELQNLINEFVDDQILVPRLRKRPLAFDPQVPKKNQPLFNNIIRLVRTYREGI